MWSFQCPRNVFLLEEQQFGSSVISSMDAFPISMTTGGLQTQPAVSHFGISKCARPAPPLPKCFIINTGLCHYKGSGPRKSLRLSSTSNVHFDFVQRVVDLCESLFDA